jgi:thiamine-phosphate pyrophosphorylase
VLDPATLLLCAITDDLRDGADGLVARAAAAVEGGATMVQLRLKDEPARTLVAIARALVARLPVPVIVNDRVDVALAAGAAGVHVGAEDVPVAAIRPFVPEGFVIGASVTGAGDLPGVEGADYAGIGPVFPTFSKADAAPVLGIARFGELAAQARVPSVAIGGVDATNAGEIVRAGASGIAVIRAVFGSGDPRAAALALRRAIGR